MATSVGPRTKPSHPWRLDSLPYGNNDFCSTKLNIINASVTDSSGKGISVNGEGKQHLRSWKKAENVFVLIADYSNSGGESFLNRFTDKEKSPLKVGNQVSGIVRIEAASESN